LRTLWLSLDPYMRGRMSDAPSYAKPVGIGDVMEGGTVSEVVASNLPRFAKGDIVVGRTGWQTRALSDGSGLQKVDPTRAPIQTALGVLGMPGMTAYMGLLEIGKPVAGETMVVAAASGAVGSVVGQIARIKGRLFRECRWRGIRGCVSPPQSVRPHSGVRTDFHVQRDLAVTRSDPPAAFDASDLDQTVDVSGFHRLRLFCAS